MCDLKTLNRKSCYGIDGKRLKPVKLTKWELPVPSAKSYWEGVIKDVEKKCTKVRHTYPFSFPSPAAPLSLNKSLLSDDIKFKISPPTPLHKPYRSDSLTSDNQKDTRPTNDLDKNLKLPPSIRKKIKTKPIEKKPPGSIEVKIYPAKSCPLHKREEPCKIFDDDISQYLKRPVSSVPKLPHVARQKKVVPCEHRKPVLSKSSSASSIRLKSIERTVIDEFRERKFTKPPKLGMASLLPSFAKQVSTDSSGGTRESLELEDEELEIQIQPKTESGDGVFKRNFLRVPNLSFVSSHPSFRKLSLIDSCDKEEEEGAVPDMSVIVEEKLSATAETQAPKKKTLTFKDGSLGETKHPDDAEKKPQESTKKVELTEVVAVTKPSTVKKKRPKTVADYEKKYAHKALDFLTKYKHKNFHSYPSIPSLKTSLSSGDSLEIESIKLKRGKSAHHKYQDSSIDLEEIQKNLRETAKKYLDLDHIPDSFPKKSEKSTTIRTSSRTTSGMSPLVKSNNVFAPSADVLKRIPRTRLFNRPKIDKCHSCIYKPITDNKPKIKRELPLSSLKSIVDNPPNFKISSSSSSSSLDELFNFTVPQDDEINKRFDLTKLKTLGLEDEDEKKPSRFGSKSDHRVSFDETNISDTLSVNADSVGDKTPSPKLIQFKDGRLSVQSSDRSKTSTPTKSQSSDSDGMVESNLPSSKHIAPCHKPLVWAHNLDQLRALKWKKATSLRARAAALMEKSSDETDGEDINELQAKKDFEAEEKKESRKETKKKRKKLKPLVRTKTVEDVLEEREKRKKTLKRSKTTFDLPSLTDASKSDDSDGVDESSVEEEESTMKVEKQEVLPMAEEILKHRAASPAPPTLSKEDILEIIAECLKEDLSPTEVFDKLNQEFIRRIEEKCETFKDFEEVKYLKQGLNLFKALVDSRRYLKPDLFDPNLKFSQKQPPVTNTRQLRRILPSHTFDMVAPLLGMPIYHNERRAKVSLKAIIGETSDESNVSTNFTDMIVHPRTPDSLSTDRQELNPYALFLKKPRRLAVVWRPLCEEDLKGYDPEATLELRAERLLDKICKDFCEWLKNLGGTVLDEETLKDMFEIVFSSEACKTIQVIKREIPTVPTVVANVRRCPQASKLKMTMNEIAKDLEVEKRERRTHAFGHALPHDLRFVPPLHKLTDIWVRTERIPKDLETMDIVWDGIMGLESVKSFISYLKEHRTPENMKLLKKLIEREKSQAKQQESVESILQKPKPTKMTK